MTTMHVPFALFDVQQGDGFYMVAPIDQNGVVGPARKSTALQVTMELQRIPDGAATATVDGVPRVRLVYVGQNGLEQLDAWAIPLPAEPLPITG
jgi:hypothetical protein